MVYFETWLFVEFTCLCIYIHLAIVILLWIHLGWANFICWKLPLVARPMSETARKFFSEILHEARARKVTRARFLKKILEGHKRGYSFERIFGNFCLLFLDPVVKFSNHFELSSTLSNSSRKQHFQGKPDCGCALVTRTFFET